MSTIISADHNNAPFVWRYQDLQNNTLCIDGREVSIDLVRVSENTAAGWQKAAPADPKKARCFYEVTISANADMEVELKNLQYFFIRADRETQPDGPRLGLLVHLPEKPKNKLFKLKTFLAMLSHSRKQYDLLYTIDPGNGNCCPIAPWEQSKDIQLGNMMPLLRVVADASRMLSGDILLSDLLDSREQKLSDDDIIACCAKGHSPRIWWDSLKNCCRIILHRTAVKLSKPTAKALADLICAKRTGMPLMAELLWFFHLQALDKHNKLAEKNGPLNEEIVEQVRKDAIICAEALTQILENSCQHTQQHAAYLCLRLHQTSLSGSVDHMTASIRNRNAILRRYTGMWDPSDRRLKQNEALLLQDAKHYFEISITDDATVTQDPCGILDHYLKKNTDGAATPPCQLKDLFEDSSFINLEHTVLHYGLQALRQHILVNRGSFLVTSPRGKQTEKVLFRSDGTLDQRTTDACSHTTEYHILLPLGMPHQDLRDSIAAAPAGGIESILDLSCLTDPENTPITVIPKIVKQLSASGFPNQDKKNDGVTTYANDLIRLMEGPANPDHTIFQLDIRALDHVHTELFSKALFRTILNGKRKQLRFALFFRDTMQQQIAIRMCAVFYRRCRRLLPHIPGTEAQVALCVLSSLGYPEVNMILNFREWNAMTETMIRYAYNNLAASHDLYAQIKYFLYAPDADRHPAVQAPRTETFPFDLYLTDPMDDPDKNGLSAEGFQYLLDPKGSSGRDDLCWFLQNVQSTLTQDIQQGAKDGGIKVNDIHVHLPAGIHVESFYAADLLFRNVAYVCRFAYLLALRLKQDTGFHSDRGTLIVCYEAYSSLLMQYLEYYLNQITPSRSEWGHVRSAVVYREKPHSAQLYLPSDLEDKCLRDARFFENWNFIVLCPIATTLSTVHMLHELISRKCAEATRNNVRDYTIILVGQLPEDDKPLIQNNYWTPSDRDTVALSDRRSDNCRWPVGYVIRTDVRWHDPSDCPNQNDRALVHADTTATELKLLFPLKLTEEEASALLRTPAANREDPARWHLFHRHDVCSLIAPAGLDADAHRARLAENDRRLKLLKGCIYYSHIAKSSNHYAYYLEFPQCYEHIRSAENRADWYNWLCSLRKSPRRDVLTILVAPLRLGISPFLKDLIDHVFTESIHVLQLDLLNSRRQDILTKYCYVAQVCRDALKADPSLEIHFHYIDDSIVTADTLRRGRSMVDMLLRSCISADVMDTRVRLFRDVYVMLNRSSRDTAQSLVEDPDRNFHAYMHLAVPHFNTHNDYCPSCAQVEKFQHLKKCSSTNRFAGEFQRLAAKHAKRSPEEYVQWQEQQLLNSRSAFLRMRQWVYNRHGIAPEGLEKEFRLVEAHLQTVRRDAYAQILSRYRAMVARENREARWENKDSPLQPDLVKVADLLQSLNSLDFYRRKYLACNPGQDAAKLEDTIRSLHGRIRQEFLKEMAELKLCDHQRSADWEKTHIAYRQLWFRGVLADQAYRRMITVHDAFSTLVLEKETRDVAQMSRMILDFLQHRRILGDAAKTTRLTTVEIIDKWEWLHSGLKVLSRNELVHYHMVRASMFQILRQIALTMLSDWNAAKLPPAAALLRLRPTSPVITLAGPRDRAIDPLLRYQLFSGIMRRLSDMQSSFPIETLHNNDIPQALQHLTENFFCHIRKDDNGRQWFYCPIPSYDRMISDYEKYIKLSTMAEDDETRSTQIQDSYHSQNTNREGTPHDEN